MKKFLKKTNRGLLLSAIVLAVLVIYVIADYFSFQSQKDTINQVVINYYNEIYDGNIEVSGASAENYDKFKNIIEKYWTDAESSSEWSIKKSDMMNFYNNVSNNTDVVFDISDVNISISNIKVKKIGPGYASVTLSFSVSATGMSDSFFMTPSNCRKLSEDEEYYYDYEEYDVEPDENEEKPYLGTLKYNVTDAIVELHKEDGTWKICSIDAYSDYSTFVAADKEGN